jgi:CRISPR-associated exonuclease Cas4
MMNGEKIPYPVEYKSGKPKHDSSDLVQLCAQVLCLEEMLDVTIPHAAIFYGKPRRRMIVDIDEDLRKQTECTINEIRLMIDSKTIPRAIYTPKCDSCSLFDECMPQAGQRLLKQYIEELFKCDEETR